VVEAEGAQAEEAVRRAVIERTPISSVTESEQRSQALQARLRQFEAELEALQRELQNLEALPKTRTRASDETVRP
jgi:hypothetical protein